MNVMSYLNFEWDQNKAESNKRKHDVTFNEAESAFYDEYSRMIPDPDSSFGEERFIIIGVSEQSNTLVVCHCYRNDGECIRIISARKADKRERKQYEEYRYA